MKKVTIFVFKKVERLKMNSSKNKCNKLIYFYSNKILSHRNPIVHELCIFQYNSNVIYIYIKLRFINLKNIKQVDIGLVIFP